MSPEPGSPQAAMPVPKTSAVDKAGNPQPATHRLVTNRTLRCPFLAVGDQTASPASAGRGRDGGLGLAGGGALQGRLAGDGVGGVGRVVGAGGVGGGVAGAGR